MWDALKFDHFQEYWTNFAINEKKRTLRYTGDYTELKKMWQRFEVNEEFVKAEVSFPGIDGTPMMRRGVDSRTRKALLNEVSTIGEFPSWVDDNVDVDEKRGWTEYGLGSLNPVQQKLLSMEWLE